MGCDRNLDGQTAVGLSEHAVAWPAVHFSTALVFDRLTGGLVARTLAAIDVNRLARHENR